jgi:16S rRNA processing protein RimM
VDKNSTHLQVGVITRPHGLRGELKVRLHNEDSTALDEATHIVVESPKGEATRHEIESVRGSSKGPILALSGVQGREGAEKVKGFTLWVERGAVVPLEPGEYYLVDLVGCSVFFEDKVFAKVTGVRPDPTVDTMILTLENGKTAELPIVDAWVGEVDIVARKVQLLSQDGVIEG